MREETYCLSCRKYTKNINPRIVKSKNNRLMIQSNCAIAQYEIVKNLDLLKNTKRVDY